MSFKEAYWVIASPTFETYFPLSFDEEIKTYNEMAFEEFDKQFTKTPDTEKKKSETVHCPANTELKKITIEFGIDSWGAEPLTDASLCALIYTTPRGRPIGEANYIRKADGGVNIAHQLEEFYKRFKWRAETNSIPKEMTPEIITKERNDAMILKKIHTLRY